QVEPGPEHEAAVTQLWETVGGPTPRALFVLAALLVLGWLGLTGFGLLGQWTRRCFRCGEAACHRCNPRLGNSGEWTDCEQVQRGGASKELRLQKEIDSHRFFARRLTTQRLVNVLGAGAAQLVRGNTRRGVLLMIVSFTLLVLLAFGLGVV